MFGAHGVEGSGAIGIRRVGHEIVQEPLPTELADALDALAVGATLGELVARGLDGYVEPAIARGLIVGVGVPEGEA